MQERNDPAVVALRSAARPRELSADSVAIHGAPLQVQTSGALNIDEHARCFVRLAESVEKAAKARRRPSSRGQATPAVPDYERSDV